MITARELSTLSKNELVTLICDFQEASQHIKGITFEEYYKHCTLLNEEQFRRLRPGDILYDGKDPVTILDGPYYSDEEQCWAVETDVEIKQLGDLYSCFFKFSNPGIFTTIRWCYDDIVGVLIDKGIPEELAKTKVYELNLNPEAFKDIVIEYSWDVLRDMIDL